MFFFLLHLCSCNEGAIYFPKHYYLFKANVDGEIVYLVMTNKREELTYPFEQEILEINTKGDIVYWRSVENIYHILNTKSGDCLHLETSPDMKFLPVKEYWEAHSLALALLGASVTLIYSPLLIRSYLEVFLQRKELQRMGPPAQMPLLMPYHELATRIDALSRVEDGASMGTDYLCWKSPEYGRLLISRVDESDWKALYWVGESHGVAVYRRGDVSVYPAVFETAFLKNILLPTRKAFTAWLSARGSGSRR